MLVTAGCGAAGGVAGISTRPPAPVPGSASAGATGSPAATPTGRATPVAETFTKVPASPGAVRPPAVADPVQVPPPKVSPYRYVFPVKGCPASYTRQLLVIPKTTIWTGKGCAFVAPIDGVVDEVVARNRWNPGTDRGADREGRFVSIIGADGVRYLGGHLDAVAPGISAGTKVQAGQLLGRIGNSGNARGDAPNLYFAVSWDAPPAYWWIRRGMVNPWSYLDAWRDGNPTLSPRTEVLALRSRLGATPKCTQLCTSGTKPVKPTPKPTHRPTNTVPPSTTTG